MTEWKNIDWALLKELRGQFLGEERATHDYWREDKVLEHYDLTFAQRIGWKFAPILKEAEDQFWKPRPSSALLDWGCGTGIATRTFLRVFPAALFSSLWLSDRSASAVAFARKKIMEEFPGTNPSALKTKLPPSPYTLLVSHVLGELDDVQAGELIQLINEAESVFWVEPGTPQLSRRLISVREEFREKFNVLGPCRHKASCGLLEGARERDWCHHFASPPPFVFTDGNWVKFGKTLGIDLRSLAVSYLSLTRADVSPPSVSRIIGRRRIYKGYAQVLDCTKEGVADRKILQKESPDLVRKIKQGGFVLAGEEPTRSPRD